MMLNRCKARFWWAIRNWWHYPQFWHSGDRYVLFDSAILSFYWSHRNYRALIKKIKLDIRLGLHRIYWDLRYLQPLRCNGNKGGWRTRVCDWLEEKARSYEVEDDYPTDT